MGVLISLAIFFSAVIIHEFSHALVANRLGDPTAKMMGRLTLNPISHIDPFGTILLPVLLILMNSPVLFGWAKPVPINYANLKNPKRDIVWVGLAGPVANLLFAGSAAMAFNHLGLRNTELLSSVVQSIIIVNVVLAVFNLIPIPPLDGSRVLTGLLPPPLDMKIVRMEPYGFILLFALLYMGLFDYFVWPIATFVLRLLMKL